MIAFCLFDLGFAPDPGAGFRLKLTERLSCSSVSTWFVLLLGKKSHKANIGGCYASSIEGLKLVKLHIRNVGSSVNCSFDYPSQTYAFY